MNKIYLSYSLNENTPSYGNKSKFIKETLSVIGNDSLSNSSRIQMNCHLGTHIDFPNHFHKDGQTMEDYNADFCSSGF